MTQIHQSSQNSIVTQQQAFDKKEESCQAPLSECELPLSDQPHAWQAYWRSQGQAWRIEPEIDTARQKQLATLRAVTPDPRQGIYPFKGLKLSRADVEWLLTTHEGGQGPVDWQNETQQRHEGLDLRGAVLCGDAGSGIDLHGLPLSRLVGGLARGQWSGWTRVSKDLLALAAVNLEASDLFGAHLEGATLTAARLNQADLREAHLEGAYLTGAHLEGANLTGAHLEGANLTGAYLEGAYLTGAQLTKANLHGAHLEHAMLFSTQLKDAYLVGAHLEEANLTGAQLEGADLREARLGKTILSGAQLGGTDLAEAILIDKHGVGPRLAAIQWGSTDLSSTDWLQVKQLDDEYCAYQEKKGRGAQNTILAQSNAFKKAVKAYRQLSLALRAQGLNEEAAYFSYRAHLLYREVLWQQVTTRQDARKRDRPISSRFFQFSIYLLSSFLYLTAGYGYKPWRSITTCLLVVITFALAYSVVDHVSLLPNALILSLVGFSGRGFFSDPAATNTSMILVALEALVGLLIEISSIVVFTRRFLEQ